MEVIHWPLEVLDQAVRNVVPAGVSQPDVRREPKGGPITVELRQVFDVAYDLTGWDEHDIPYIGLFTDVVGDDWPMDLSDDLQSVAGTTSP